MPSAPCDLVRLRFGLAAWSNAHFDNALYPLRTPHVERLPRYAKKFDCVEADILHHRDASAGTLSEWVAQTPPGFLFLPKMNKAATHGKTLMPATRGRSPPPESEPPDVAAAETALASLSVLRDAKRMGRILLQFPPRTTREAGWDHLVELLGLSEPGTFAVEFRDASWFVPATASILEDFDAPLVWSTHPKAFAPPWRTSSTGYVRFVGPHHNTRGRHTTVADRLGDILEIRKRMTDASWKECFVIVTNGFEGNAVDALPRIAAALDGPATGRRFAHEPGRALFPDP